MDLVPLYKNQEALSKFYHDQYLKIMNHQGRNKQENCMNSH